MLRIAAAIVHYGRIEETLASLGALQRSTLQVEAVVVDNASDGPPDEIAGLTPAVDWIEPGENLGYGGGLNLATSRVLDLGRFDALLGLNNDARVDPQAVGRLEAALAADPRCAVGAPRIVRAGATETLWYGGGEIDWLRGSARVLGAGGPADAPQALRARDVGFASGCAMLLRLEALVEVGGFDTRYFLYEEDVEMSIRLRRAGWSLRYVPEAIVRHAGQGSQRAVGEPFVAIHRPENPRAAKLTELQVCNRCLTVRRHAGPLQRLAFGVYFPLYWTARSLAARRSDGPGIAPAVRRGLSRYRRLRREPPLTELTSSGRGHLGTRTTWSPS